MRKAIKLCLALAMVGSLATTVYAGEKEYSLYGRTRAYFSNVTEKAAGADDSATVMDMAVDGRLGHTISDKGDVWTTTATSHFNVGEDGPSSMRDLYVEFAKEDLEIRVGRYYMTDVYAWSNYAYFEDVAEDAGSAVVTDSGRISAVRVKLPQVGLAIDLGINGKGDADNTADGGYYTQTDLHARFDKSMGDISFGASYHSQTTSVDEKNGGVKDGAKDGGSNSSIGLAAKYTMGEMAFLFGADSYSKQSNKDADKLSGLMIEFGFDMGLGDGSGIGVSLVQHTSDESTEVKNTATKMSVGYAMPVGGAMFYAGYNSISEKTDEDGAEAATESGMYAGVVYGF